MDANKPALKKLDDRQGAIKNNKIRQHIQAGVAGDSDGKVGVGSLGHTR